MVVCLVSRGKFKRQAENLGGGGVKKNCPTIWRKIGKKKGKPGTYSRGNRSSYIEIGMYKRSECNKKYLNYSQCD